MTRHDNMKQEYTHLTSEKVYFGIAEELKMLESEHLCCIINLALVEANKRHISGQFLEDHLSSIANKVLDSRDLE